MNNSGDYLLGTFDESDRFAGSMASCIDIRLHFSVSDSQVIYTLRIKGYMRGPSVNDRKDDFGFAKRCEDICRDTINTIPKPICEGHVMLIL